MNRVIALLLILALPYSLVAADAQNGYKVTYDGGSLLDTKAGTGLKLKISQEKIVFVENQKEVASIPPRQLLKSATDKTFIVALVRPSGWPWLAFRHRSLNGTYKIEEALCRTDLGRRR